MLSQSLQDFHMHHKATFSFVVQFLENLDEQPVEDIGVCVPFFARWLQDLRGPC